MGYDAAVHMSEETTNAARDMPRAMLGSVVVSGVLTFPYIIALLLLPLAILTILWHLPRAAQLLNYLATLREFMPVGLV